MSTSLSIIGSHNWKRLGEIDFRGLTESLSAAHQLPKSSSSSDSDSNVHWRPYLNFRNADEEYETEGSTMLILPFGGTIRIGFKVFALNTGLSWVRFLTERESRSAANEVAKKLRDQTESEYMILLPAGSFAEESVYSGKGLSETLSALVSRYGSPNLFAERLYTMDEIQLLSDNRVSYMLTK